MAREFLELVGRAGPDLQESKLELGCVHANSKARATNLGRVYFSTSSITAYGSRGNSHEDKFAGRGHPEVSPAAKPEMGSMTVSSDPVSPVWSAA